MTDWRVVTKGKIKNSNASKLIKASKANYFPYTLTNVVETKTIAKPEQSTSSAAQSSGQNPSAKMRRNNRKKFRKRELKRAFASINKAFAETAARLDAELRNILSNNDSMFETISNMLDTAEEDAEAAETAILDSAATSSCCPTRSSLKKTGRQSDRLFQVPTGQVAEAGEEREWPHGLRAPANVVHEVPEMKQDPLMSMPKLVDAGYTPIMTKDDVKIYNTADVEFMLKILG